LILRAPRAQNQLFKQLLRNKSLQFIARISPELHRGKDLIDLRPDFYGLGFQYIVFPKGVYQEARDG
jgi:hypothetical protein